ncbi:hypothetical protein GW17_00058084 [Ensete ventricosum]|nr:hypothetical protein GW17_00058084 [Ensete ventricosum]
MLRPGVTQEWVDESEMLRERTKNRRWQRPYDVLAEATCSRSPSSSHENLYAMEMTPGGDMVQRIVMKALVISIWGLCTTEGEVRLQVPWRGLDYTKENRIGVSPTTRWRRPCMRVVVCLSIDKGELLGGHSGVEADGRKGRGSDDESSGARLPKSKASVRKEVDSEEHHSAAEADLPIIKEGMQMQGNR